LRDEIVKKKSIKKDKKTKQITTERMMTKFNIKIN
jgi:hypothetical protein